MKLKCKKCQISKKIKSLDELACDDSECPLLYPGTSEVLSFEDLKKAAVVPTIIEDIESPPPVPYVTVPYNDLWNINYQDGSHSEIPNPHKGEFPYDFGD